MINLLIGPSGGGKSFEAVVYHIIPAIEKGRQVITNLPLNVEHFRLVYGDDKANLIKLIHPTASNPIPFKTINDFCDTWRMSGDNPIGSLYVIDECHKPFRLGEVNKEVDEWFAEHRHELADVLLLTQSYGKIWKSIRDNVQVVYRVRKNVAIGAPKSYVKKVQDGIRGEILNTSIRFYDEKYYPFYNSHTRSDTSAKESTANDIVPIWRNWTFLGAAILLPIGIYLLLTNPMPFMPDNSKPILQKPVQHSPAVSQSPQPQQPNAITTTQQQMESKTKEQDKVEANHPYYKLQMHIGGYIESEKITENVKSLFMYNVLLSQNGQVMARITDKDLTKAGYQLEPLGSCLFKITYKQFFDYITCDAPTVSPNSEKNFEQPQQNKVASNQ